MSDAAATVYTVGHSNRSSEAFIALLGESGVELLVDVRRLPGSRVFPQFDSSTLAASLRQAGIDYRWMQALGGRRGRSLPPGDTRNAFWENASFHHYADYALTAPFADALAELETLAARQRCVIMCAEAVWWRCHRRIITDHLLARGHPVRHIMAPGKVTEATLTPGAVAHDGSVTYPPASLTHASDLFDTHSHGDSA